MPAIIYPVLIDMWHKDFLRKHPIKKNKPYQYHPGFLEDIGGAFLAVFPSIDLEIPFYRDNPNLRFGFILPLVGLKIRQDIPLNTSGLLGLEAGIQVTTEFFARISMGLGSER